MHTKSLDAARTQKSKNLGGVRISKHRCRFVEKKCLECSRWNKIVNAYLDGLSFKPLKRARRETFWTLHTLYLIPGMSPLDLPFLPNPSSVTMSFMSILLIAPSYGTKALIFFPFFISWTLTALRMAEFGCFASTSLKSVSERRSSFSDVPTYFIIILTYIFSKTMPFACGATPIMSCLYFVPSRRFRYTGSHLLLAFLLCLSFFAQKSPFIWG